MTTEEGTSYLFNMLDQARTQMSFMANYLFDGYPLMGDSHSNFELQKRERETTRTLQKGIHSEITVCFVMRR